MKITDINKIVIKRLKNEIWYKKSAILMALLNRETD